MRNVLCAWLSYIYNVGIEGHRSQFGSTECQARTEGLSASLTDAGARSWGRSPGRGKAHIKMRIRSGRKQWNSSTELSICNGSLSYLSPNPGPQGSKAALEELTALLFWAVLTQRLGKCLCLGEGPGQIDTVCLLGGILGSVRWVETCVEVLVCKFERAYLDIFEHRFCHMSFLCIHRKENRSQINWRKCQVKYPALRCRLARYVAGTFLIQPEGGRQ